jgi:Uma2 family endonuclease
MAQPTPAPSAPPKLSYEDFLRWDGENPHVEWVDGEVIEMSPVSLIHSGIVVFLATLFRTYIGFHSGGEIHLEPFQMKTGHDLPGRSPDLLYVAPENLHRLKRDYLDGPADLVVEVASPDDPQRDRGVKLREYERGGVREYWLIDPQVKEAVFYVRNDQGYYEEAPQEDGIFHSRVLGGLWIKVDWLWQTPLPAIPVVLREWKLI